jgi:hypothetical protein
MSFNSYIHEMLDLVDKMSSDLLLDTKRYTVAPIGIRDNKTGAILGIENALVGVMCTILHPNLKPRELERSILKLGYTKKEADSSSTRYVLNKYADGLPNAIAVLNDGKGLANCELSKNKKQVLSPLKKILEEITK